MSLTPEEIELKDAMKRHQKNLAIHKEKYRIIGLAQLEFGGDEVIIEAEDRAAVDLAKADLQAEADAKAREAELLAIAISELEE